MSKEEEEKTRVVGADRRENEATEAKTRLAVWARVSPETQEQVEAAAAEAGETEENWVAKAVTQKILGREAIPVYVVMDRQASKDIEAAAATAGIALENYMGRKILGQVAEREPTWDEMEQVRVKLIVVDHADILERVEAELEADEDWLTETLKERLTAQ